MIDLGPSMLKSLPDTVSVFSPVRSFTQGAFSMCDSSVWKTLRTCFKHKDDVLLFYSITERGSTLQHSCRPGLLQPQ